MSPSFSIPVCHDRNAERLERFDGTTPLNSRANAIITGTDWSAERLLFQLSAAFIPELPHDAFKGPCPRIGNVLSFLQRRFTREERLMCEIGYPDFSQHLAEHQAVFSRLAALHGILRSRCYDPAQVLDSLETWAVDHIERYDKPFGRFLACYQGGPEGSTGAACPAQNRPRAAH